MTDDIADNLAAIRARIAAAAQEAGREGEKIDLVAVSKRQSEARIDKALATGHRVYGENRVQEAEARWAARRDRHEDLVLHLIGPLQTNKAADAVALFDVIEVIDRPKLARALARAMETLHKRPRLLIQVNTGLESQKSGVPPAELADLLTLCRDECGLAIDGLMCLPPIDEAPAPHFALLAELAAKHGLKTLSMGMTGDFESAIHQGSTEVRVGTAIFGPRET